MDIDLKELLDDLVVKSIKCIGGLTTAEKLLLDPTLSPADRESILASIQSIRLTLNDIRDSFHSTIGYH